MLNVYTCANILSFQNPGYMKDNFVIMIESFHIGDVGNQHNVSTHLKFDEYFQFISCLLSQIGSRIAA